MTELIVTRGIPGSGKTTWARAWVAEDPNGRARVNRDDLRQTLYGRDAPLPVELEDGVTAAQHNAVRGLLRSGRSVVVDDMNLNASRVKAWEKLVADIPDVEIEVKVFDEPLALCLDRDRLRGSRGEREVGADFIREVYGRFQNALRAEKTGTAVVTPDAPYRYHHNYDLNPSRSWAVIFDVDGTLALNTGRSPFDADRLHEDAVNMDVAELARQLDANGLKILVLSGRENVQLRNGMTCLQATARWLSNNDVPVFELHMRALNDHRKDRIIKEEIFRERIAPRYNVLAVFDDRNQVVDMWREIGLTCLQVAPGDF